MERTEVGDQKTEVTRADLNAEKIKGSSRPRGRGRQHARRVRSPDRTPSSRPCPIEIRSLPTLTHVLPPISTSRFCPSMSLASPRLRSLTASLAATAVRLGPLITRTAQCLRQLP